ncbi:hypothetical protein Tco_0675955 [Tanacetum coccineum]
MNDIVSSDKEWEESDYGNPPNTATDSFFKPYLNAQEKMTLKKRMNEAKRSYLIASVDMVDKLQMVELDIVFDYCYSCCDKPTPLGLKMIHKLHVDLHRCHRHRNHVHVIDQFSKSQIERVD